VPVKRWSYSSGQVDSGTIILEGGSKSSNPAAKAIDTKINGGIQVVSGGDVVAATVQNNGYQEVYSGGTTTGTIRGARRHAMDARRHRQRHRCQIRRISVGRTPAARVSGTTISRNGRLDWNAGPR